MAKTQCRYCGEEIRFIDSAWIDSETYSICVSGRKHAPPLAIVLAPEQWHEVFDWCRQIQTLAQRVSERVDDFANAVPDQPSSSSLASAPPHATSDGVSRIAAERQRQTTAEGWTPEHDDEHGHGEMAIAAIRYALEDVRFEATTARLALASLWSWSSCWWKPKDPIRNLVRAGALIAAEIDRRLRAAVPASAPPQGQEDGSIGGKSISADELEAALSAVPVTLPGTQDETNEDLSRQSSPCPTCGTGSPRSQPEGSER